MYTNMAKAADAMNEQRQPTTKNKVFYPQQK